MRSPFWFRSPAPPCIRPLNGGGRIRTFEGVSRQIYSLLPLATWVPHRSGRLPLAQMAHSRDEARRRADGGNRTHDLPLTRRLLCHLSYVSDSRSFLRDS